MNKQNILISLEPRHAESILAGRKIFELRRRPIRVDPGAVVWMYAKLPAAQVVGFATVSKIHCGSPSSLWRRFGRCVGISRKEFFDYFYETDAAFALELTQTARLKTPVSLTTLRQIESGFQPPQFFKRLEKDGPVFRAMSEQAT